MLAVIKIKLFNRLQTLQSALETIRRRDEKKTFSLTKVLVTLAEQKRLVNNIKVVAKLTVYQKLFSYYLK